MKKRMNYDGGNTQDGRNVRGKYKSFLSACHNSYQAEWITFNNEKYRCLINPDKLTVDYDQKEISIDFNAGMQNGDTFLWDRTGTHWIVYLQRLEEEAYFRAQIRQCEYSIDVNGKKYWIYLRGPVETALIWKQKHSIEINELNYSLLFYIKQDAETNEFFKRFKKVKFDGHNWKVVAVDRYSQPGLMEVYLDEDFDNSMEDAEVAPEIESPDPMQTHIAGPHIVEAFQTDITYSLVDLPANGKFVVNSSKVKIVKSTKSSCVIDILTGRAGSFFVEYQVEQPGKGWQTAAQIDVKIKSL